MTIFLVCESDYDGCAHLAAFTDRQAAEAFAEMARQKYLTNAIGQSVDVVEIELDPPERR